MENALDKPRGASQVPEMRADKSGVLESAQYSNEVSHQADNYCNRTGSVRFSL